MEIIVVAILSYLLFTFISEQVNPLKKPKNVFARRRRRLGIACGLALMTSGMIAALTTSSGELNKLLLTTLFLAALFSSPYIAEYVKTKQRK